MEIRPISNPVQPFRGKWSRSLTFSTKSLMDMIRSALRGQTMTKTELIEAPSNEDGLTTSKAQEVVYHSTGISSPFVLRGHSTSIIPGSTNLTLISSFFTSRFI